MSLLDDHKHLIDANLPQEARARFQAAADNQESLAASVADAEQAFKSAIEARSGLAEQVGRGDAVSPKAIAAAQVAVRDAEATHTFAKEAQTAGVGRVEAASRDHGASHNLAHAPLFEAGIGLRIEAAKRREIAQRELYRADAIYDEATDVIKFAVSNGAPISLKLLWPRGEYSDTWFKCNSEREETLRWGRTFPDPVATDA